MGTRSSKHSDPPLLSEKEKMRKNKVEAAKLAKKQESTFAKRMVDENSSDSSSDFERPRRRRADRPQLRTTLMQELNNEEAGSLGHHDSSLNVQSHADPILSTESGNKLRKRSQGALSVMKEDGSSFVSDTSGQDKFNAKKGKKIVYKLSEGKHAAMRRVLKVSRFGGGDSGCTQTLKSGLTLQLRRGHD